jgi:hypothetical protein
MDDAPMMQQRRESLLDTVVFFALSSMPCMPVLSTPTWYVRISKKEMLQKVILKWGLNRESAVQDAGPMQCGLAAYITASCDSGASTALGQLSFQAHLAQQLVGLGVVLVGVVQP